MKRMQLMQNTIWKTSSLCAYVLTVYDLSWGYGNLITKSAQDAPHQSVNALYKWMAQTTQSLEKISEKHHTCTAGRKACAKKSKSIEPVKSPSLKLYFPQWLILSISILATFQTSFGKAWHSHVVLSFDACHPSHKCPPGGPWVTQELLHRYKCFYVVMAHFGGVDRRCVGWFPTERGKSEREGCRSGRDQTTHACMYI